MIPINDLQKSGNDFIGDYHFDNTPVYLTETASARSAFFTAGLDFEYYCKIFDHPDLRRRDLLDDIILDIKEDYRKAREKLISLNNVFYIYLNSLKASSPVKYDPSGQMSVDYDAIAEFHDVFPPATSEDEMISSYEDSSGISLDEHLESEREYEVSFERLVEDEIIFWEFLNEQVNSGVIFIMISSFLENTLEALCKDASQAGIVAERYNPRKYRQRAISSRLEYLSSIPGSNLTLPGNTVAILDAIREARNDFAHEGSIEVKSDSSIIRMSEIIFNCKVLVEITHMETLRGCLSAREIRE